MTTTYQERLFRVREGLADPVRAVLTSPLALVADVGTAVSRAPLKFTDLLANDAGTSFPKLSKRYRHAENYFAVLEAEQSEEGLQASRGNDERSTVAKGTDFLRWTATLPVKTAAVPVIDTLGAQPWKNMIRRTRTMFERESNFVPDVPEAMYVKAIRAGANRGNKSLRQMQNDVYASCRYGAARWFARYASNYFSVPPDKKSAERPKVTLIGHSMGAIVAGEMLHRSHSYSEKRMPVDNVVFMAAACSINDFKNKVVPYLASRPTDKNMGQGPNTRFYNLCLNDKAERSEKNPGEWDLSPRGSLLVWIDTMYQDPESENDRTFGRWENAILGMDDVPADVLGRTTLKGFGRYRRPTSTVASDRYTTGKGHRSKRVVEPMKHGDMSRLNPKNPNDSMAFWERVYWDVEE